MKVLREKDLVLIKEPKTKYFSVLIYQDTTKAEHERIKHEYFTKVGKVLADVFFDWKTTSVFVIRTESPSNDSKLIDEISGEYKYAYITNYEDEILVNKLDQLSVGFNGGIISLIKHNSIMLRFDLNGVVL